MFIKKLRLNYFGRFHDREIDLEKGINLIYGENESGKSTIHSFIKGMLFGVERLRGRGAATKEDLYTRYLPWDYPGAFGGRMDIQTGGKTYRLQRSFHANDKSFTIIDLETGREFPLEEGYISELIPHLNESTFKNTISIEQLKAQTDTELPLQVRDYITNLSIAKSKEVNVTKAVASLTEKKKALEIALNATEIKELQEEIEDGLMKEEQLTALASRLQELVTENQELNNEKEKSLGVEDKDLQGKMEEFPAILEKYRGYEEYQNQCIAIEKQVEEWKLKLMTWEQESNRAEQLKTDLKEAVLLNAQSPINTQARMELVNEREAMVRKENRKNLILSLIPVIGASILNLAFIHNTLVRLGLSLGTLILGGILLGILSLKTNKRKKVYDIEVECLTNALAEIEYRLSLVLRKNGVNTIQELSANHEEVLKSSYVLEHGREQVVYLNERRELLEDKCDIIREEIMRFMQYFTGDEELDKESMERLWQAIEHKKQEFTRNQEERNHRYIDIQNKQNKIRWEIDSLEGNEEQLMRNQQQLEILTQKREEDIRELEAVKLALATIQSLSVDIHDSFGQKLNHAVSNVISTITNQRYHDLKLDEKLEVKVGWKGDYCLLERLSAGTIDQIYFALRLAVADLLMDQEEMPIILDDSFALYDEKRTRAALQMLKERKQVIIFSCHQREQRILEEQGIPYHYVDLTME